MTQAYEEHQIVKMIDDFKNSVDKNDEEAKADSRKLMARVMRAAGTGMFASSASESLHSGESIAQYVDTILNRGFVLQPTRLSDCPEFEQSQNLKRWHAIIAERVEASEFSTRKFKSKALRLQRSTIAQSKTLHDLRQAVNAIIGPLALLREHQELLEATSPKQVALENAEATAYTESVLLELEEVTKLAAERGRVLDELLSVYNEDAKDFELLHNCETAKKEHKLSDSQAAKMFGISRNKLVTLRAEISPN